MGFWDCMANSKSITVILCLFSVILLIQGLASTEWVFANDGYRQGLFVYCPGNGTKLPVVDDIPILKPSDSGSPESPESPEDSSLSESIQEKSAEKPSKKSSDSKSSSESKSGESGEGSSSSSEEDDEDEVPCFPIDTNYQFFTIVSAWFYIATLLATLVGMFYTVLGLKSGEVLLEKPRLYRIAVWALSIGTALSLATVVMYAACFEGLRKHNESWEMGWAYICGWVVALSLYTSVLLLILGKEPQPQEEFPGEKLDEEEGGDEKAAANHN